MTFTDYAILKGINLLPDDIKWMRSLVISMPKEQRKAILTRYVEIWCQAMAECKDGVKAQNEGRRAANTWLRGIVDASR